MSHLNELWILLLRNLRFETPLQVQMTKRFDVENSQDMLKIFDCNMECGLNKTIISISLGLNLSQHVKAKISSQNHIINLYTCKCTDSHCQCVILHHLISPNVMKHLHECATTIHSRSSPGYSSVQPCLHLSSKTTDCIEAESC